MTDYEYDEYEFTECYAKVTNTVNSMVENNIQPLMIAAILTTTGLSLYKSLLSKKDYDSMLEVMVEFKDAINQYENKGYIN